MVPLVYKPQVLYDVQHLADEAKERVKQAYTVKRALREHLAFLMRTPILLVFPGNEQVPTLRTLMDSGANVASLADKYMDDYDGPRQQGSPVYGAGWGRVPNRMHYRSKAHHRNPQPQEPRC